MQIDIQSRGCELSDALEDHVRRRVQFALSWAHHYIRRIEVRLVDENGPRGGLDKRCQIVCLLDGHPDLVIEDVESDVYAAIDRASDRVGRTLSRKIARWREHRHMSDALVNY